MLKFIFTTKIVVFTMQSESNKQQLGNGFTKGDHYLPVQT